MRVLIEAVTWYGLRSLHERNRVEENEFLKLRDRLGLVAERLVGVWRDYGPRLKALENGENSFLEEEEREKQQRNIERAMQMQMSALMMNQ